MKNYKIAIVGGGTAGWLCAAWISKKFPNVDLTLIESPQIPKIGVGESVTPHVTYFFSLLGIEEKDWMQKTGAIHKYANKFVDWKTGNGEYEYFSFSFPTTVDLLYKNNHYVTAKEQLHFDDDDAVRTTDTLLRLLDQGTFNKFDKHFNNQFYYMENNTSPYNDNGEYLLSPVWSWAQHINAELAGDYARDYIAIPNGTIHIRSLVEHVIKVGDDIKKVKLQDGREIEADMFIDASGFHRVLTKDWEFKEYQDNPINRAWVCQTEYQNPETEMVNYTQSIAKKEGWLFKIGLYHRMGTGYCFGSDFISDEQALEDYHKMIGQKLTDPRLIKWEPKRLKTLAKANTVAVGLSAGFAEPMEANALYIIFNSIHRLDSVLNNYFSTGVLDYTDYNARVGYCLDDIADFVLVHYTLSSRDDSNFWKEMRDVGIKKDHIGLVYDKYMNKKNTISAAINGYTLFPEYMWGQLAYSWGIDFTKWRSNSYKELDLELTKLHFEHLERKNNLISRSRMNTYQWLKQNVFQGIEYNQWKPGV
jgi:tryptophan halogenase